MSELGFTVKERFQYKLIRLTWWDEFLLMVSPVGPSKDSIVYWNGKRYCIVPKES